MLDKDPHSRCDHPQSLYFLLNIRDPSYANLSEMYRASGHLALAQLRADSALNLCSELSYIFRTACRRLEVACPVDLLGFRT